MSRPHSAVPARRARIFSPAWVLLALALHVVPETHAAAKERKSPDWTAQDSLEASAIVTALLRRPEAIDSLTAGSLSRDHGLGFGRRLRETWLNPAGKLGFAFKILYEGTRPVSFEAKPVMNYGGLRAQYLAVLAPAFRLPAAHGNAPVTHGRSAAAHGKPPATGGCDAAWPPLSEDAGLPLVALPPFYWNLEKAAQPLSADTLRLAGDSLPSQAIRSVFAFYMTPYSGTLYGIRGGDAGQLLENRDAFMGLTEILMADKKLARYLMRSVNPASRLTAAEFIVRHKEHFPEFDSLQLTAFRAVFTHPPKAATLRASLEVVDDPRKLVFEYARQEVRRDGRGVLRMY